MEQQNLKRGLHNEFPLETEGQSTTTQDSPKPIDFEKCGKTTKLLKVL
jgi:hypothetical protein